MYPGFHLKCESSNQRPRVCRLVHILLGLTAVGVLVWVGVWLGLGAVWVRDVWEWLGRLASICHLHAVLLVHIHVLGACPNALYNIMANAR